MGFNYGFWITHDSIGKIGIGDTESLVGTKIAKPLNENSIQKDIDAQRAMSWWRAKNGKNLQENE